MSNIKKKNKKLKTMGAQKETYLIFGLLLKVPTLAFFLVGGGGMRTLLIP
jgi:hypothetical protein